MGYWRKGEGIVERKGCGNSRIIIERW